MNKRTRAAAFGVKAALAAGLGSLAYPLFFRHWCLTWGARPDEVSRKLPGDELLADAGIVSTRVIDQRAARRDLAVAGADGQRPGRRVHL